MVDNPRKRSPQDRSRISLTEDWEVRYWSDAFGVTPERLRQAVEKVGHAVEKIAAELGKPVPR